VVFVAGSEFIDLTNIARLIKEQRPEVAWDADGRQ
jgi:hypothetical protein